MHTVMDRSAHQDEMDRWAAIFHLLRRLKAIDLRVVDLTDKEQQLLTAVLAGGGATEWREMQHGR